MGESNLLISAPPFLEQMIFQNMEGDSSVGEVMKENEWAQNIQKSWYIEE